jgi:hypothetical protein
MTTTGVAETGSAIDATILGMNELPVIACSLTTDELPERRRRWLSLTDEALTAHAQIEGGVRLTFRAAPGVEEEVRELAALERDCCAFATFDVNASADRVTLDVISSGDGVTAVRELFS